MVMLVTCNVSVKMFQCCVHTVYFKIKILSFTHPQVVLSLYEFLSSTGHKEDV